MTTISHHVPQQWAPDPRATWRGGPPPPPPPPPPLAPPPPPSTRLLTSAKWTTVGTVVLLIPLMGLWIMNGHEVLADLRSLAGRAAGAGSGDGKGLKGGAEAIAWWEFLIVVQWVTLCAVVLLGICAFLAGAGRAWARIACTALIVFPIIVVIFGVVDSGPRGTWGLVFLVPLVALAVLWWLPGTSRGLRAKAA